MSLVRSVLEKYKTHGGLTDTTDTSTSVSSVSDSPRGIQGKKGTSVSSVSESGKGFSENDFTESKSQKPPGHVLTKLTQGSEAPPSFAASGETSLSEKRVLGGSISPRPLSGSKPTRSWSKRPEWSEQVKCRRIGPR